MSIKTSAMVRTAIFVADVQRSRAFYEDVLGLKEVYLDVELTEGNTWKLLGQPEGSGCHAVILKAPGPSMGMVGLFELKEDAPPEVAKPAGTRAHVGEGCMVFYCQDLDPVLVALEAGGHDILSPPEPFQVRGYTKQREMIFRDPDGMMINLIEWDLDREDTPELDEGAKTSIDDVLERIRERKSKSPTQLSAEEILSARDEDRR